MTVVAGVHTDLNTKQVLEEGIGTSISFSLPTRSRRGPENIMSGNVRDLGEKSIPVYCTMKIPSRNI